MARIFISFVAGSQLIVVGLALYTLVAFQVPAIIVAAVLPGMASVLYLSYTIARIAVDD